MSVKTMKNLLRSVIPQSGIASMKSAGYRSRAAWEALKRTDLETYRLSIAKIGDFEVAYRTGSADEEVLGDSFGNDIFLSAIPEYAPTKDHIVLDVGAHIGTFSLLVATKVRSVFAIEASKDTFEFLKINVRLNRLENVVLSHVALAGESGTAVLHHDLGGNWGHSIMKQLSKSGEQVEAMSLADYLSKYNLDHVDLIKFNCEGAEFPILTGATPNTLAKIDRMLILYHCDLAIGHSLDTLTSHLTRCGYSMRIFNQSEQRGWVWASRA